MADINNQLNQTEQTLKNIEQQANRTEQALKSMHDELYNRAVGRARMYRDTLVQRFNYKQGVDPGEGVFSESIDRLANGTQNEEIIQEQQEQQEEIKNTQKAYDELSKKVSEVTNSIKHAISNVVGIIRAANNVLHTVVISIVSVFNGAIHTIQRIIQLFGNLGDRIGLTNKHTNILKGSFTELKSAIDLLVGAFNKLFNNQFIQQGRKLLSSIQSLKMMMGTELTSSTIEWANKLESAFGLSAAELVTNLREVSAVMYGLGMSAKDVQVGARNLESVGMVLSSISGYDFDTTMNKLQSGMKGLTRSIDDLGISIKATTLDAYLKRLKAQGGEYANIADSTKELTDLQLTYVRYAAIMDQFMSREAYSLENYAKSLRTTSGSLSILTSQLNGLKSALGTLALGLFSKILQPLIYIVYYVTLLIKRLGEFLGIKMQLDSNMNGGGGVDPSPIEDETKALDDMADAANKAKGSLDELDHVTSMSSSSGSSKAGASDFDYSSLLVGDDSFADKLAEVTDNFIEECKQKLIQMLKDAEQAISDFIREQTGRLIDWDELEKNLKHIGYNIKATFIGLVQVAKNVFKIIGGLVWSIGDDLNFSSLFEKFTRNIANTVSTINLILEKIAPYIQEFYDKYLSKYVIKFGEWLDGKLDLWAEKIHTVTTEWLKMTPEDLSNKVDDLGTKFENLLTTLKEISIIFKTLFGKDTEADNIFFDENASINLKNIKQTAETLNSIFSGLLDIIKGVAHELADINNDGVVDSNDLLAATTKINGMLEKVEKWVTDNKDKIITLLSEAAKTVAAIAEAKFDLIMTILNWITDNHYLVMDLLLNVQRIIKFIAEHPVMSLSISIGLSLAGQVIKTAVTAAVWKKILGVGAGGGLTTAATAAGSTLSKGLTAAISKVPVAVGVLTFTGLILFEGKKLGEYLKRASESLDNIGDDYLNTKNGLFGSFDGENISARKIEYWTYDIIKALRDLYGEDFTDRQAEYALEKFRTMLESQGELTSTEIDRIMGNVNRDFDKLKENTDSRMGIASLDSVYARRITENDKIIQEHLKNIIGNYDDAVDDISEDVGELDTVMGETSVSVSKDLDDIGTAVERKAFTFNNNVGSMAKTFGILGSTVSNVSNTIASGLDKIIGKFTEFFANDHLKELEEVTNRFDKLNTSVGIGMLNKTGTNTTKVRNFYGHANGGIPSTGSLFLANENGNAELVGNFGGYTGVANNTMIMKAMSGAVYDAVSAALKNNNSGGNTVIEVCKGGIFVGDDSTIRQLANMLNNVNATSKNNIANTSFVMK